MCRWISTSTSAGIADLAGGSVSSDMSSPVGLALTSSASASVGTLSMAGSLVCANATIATATAIAATTSPILALPVSNRIISISRSCAPYTSINQSAHSPMHLRQQGEAITPGSSPSRGSLRRFAPWTAAGRSGETRCSRGKRGSGRALGVYSSSGVQTRLRNQMDRLFNAHVSLIYEDECGKATVNSLIARSRERLTPL